MLNPAPTVSRRAPGAAASRRGELQKGGLGGEGIWLTDVGGRLKPEVEEVCKLVAEHGAILSAAHIFGPAALAVIRPEVEHLLSGGLHLAGVSGYEVSVLTTANPSPDQAEVRTQERWTYDERNANDQRARCLVERSEQTYTLQQAGPEWQVADIQLATSSRTDCSSG